MSTMHDDAVFVKPDVDLVAVRRLNVSEQKGKLLDKGHSNPDLGEEETGDFAVTLGSVPVPHEGTSTTHLPIAAGNQGCLQNAIGRMLAAVGKNKVEKNEKSALPGPADFISSRDHESLRPPKKLFYQRTWFACTIYGIFMVLLIAAVLAIVCYRLFVIPNQRLKGEVFRNSTLKRKVQRDVSSAAHSTTVVPPVSPVSSLLTAALLRDTQRVASTTEQPIIDDKHASPVSRLLAAALLRHAQRMASTPPPSHLSPVIALQASTAAQPSIADQSPVPVSSLLAAALLRDAQRLASTTPLPNLSSAAGQQASWLSAFYVPGPLQRHFK